MYRKATQEDCKSVYRLMCGLECKELPYDKFSSIFNHQVQDEHYYSLLYVENDQVMAVLNLRFEKQLHHCETIAEVMEFYVEEENRSQGIGRKMFEKACELSREYGCTQIELATNQLRKDAHRFYEREGMHNFHYKFSKALTGNDLVENAIGKV